MSLTLLPFWSLLCSPGKAGTEQDWHRDPCCGSAALERVCLSGAPCQPKQMVDFVLRLSFPGLATPFLDQAFHMEKSDGSGQDTLSRSAADWTHLLRVTCPEQVVKEHLMHHRRWI
jgi:hypothetical protein